MVTRCVMKNDKKEKIWDLFDQKKMQMIYKQ